MVHHGIDSIFSIPASFFNSAWRSFTRWFITVSTPFSRFQPLSSTRLGDLSLDGSSRYRLHFLDSSLFLQLGLEIFHPMVHHGIDSIFSIPASFFNSAWRSFTRWFITVS